MSITQLIAEGFQAALLPCSLILLVPGVAIAFASRAAFIPAVVSFAVAVSALSWVRFSARGGGFHPVVLAIAIIVGVLLLLLPLKVRLDWLSVTAGLLVGAASSELWKPCVGSEFGLLLTELPSRGYSGLFYMSIYVVCAMAPLCGLAAIHHLLPDWILEKAERIWAIGGAVILTALSVATAVGAHETLVARLFEWSVR